MPPPPSLGTAATIDPAGIPPAWVLAAVAAALAALVPGIVVLAAAGDRARGAERVARAFGVGVAVWPVALLATTAVGLAWTAAGARLTVGGLAAVLALSGIAGRRRVPIGARLPRPDLASATLCAVVGMAAVTRVAHARGLAVPSWVDGYHHTIVAELVRQAGVVPATWEPYVDAGRFYYHFGFHALAAATAWLSGVGTPTAVLWSGQVLNAAAALTTWALARRVTGHPGAAVVAAAVPATLYWFPSYFVAWGRYTQLAGLVVLPVAWLLLADAAEHRGRRQAMLAGLVAGGLLLVHYRVFVFYLVGAAIVAVAAAVAASRAARAGGRAEVRAPLLPIAGRLAGAAVVAACVAGPWVLGRVAAGARELGSAVEWSGPAGVADVPSWVFVTGANPLCIGLAARGLALGVARLRPGALLLAAGLAASVAAVHPGLLALPATWMLPPFSLAIAAYIPVALGVAMLADAAGDLLERFRGRRLAGAALALAAVVAALAGARVTWRASNESTVIATAADVEAAAWVRAHTPASARFLVSTAHWHLGTFRGLDGGYWLPLLAGRATTMPAAFYTYGSPDAVRDVTSLSLRVARGDAMTDADLREAMDRSGSTYVYVGPAAAGVAGKIGPERLRRVGWLREVYDGSGVHVFRRESGWPRPATVSELAD